MIRRLLALLALLACCSVAEARQRAFGWCQLGGQSATTLGYSSTNFFQQTFKSCSVTVYANGTLSLATLYADNSSTPLANPFTASSNGFWFFYADNARYDVSLTGGGIVGTITYPDILLSDLGGGGGTPLTSLNGLTTASQVFAAGTAGSDFNIVSAGSTHTFNFPTASGSNRGLLSSADWATFSAKQGVLSFNPPLSLAGSAVSLTVPITISQGGTNAVTAGAAFTNLSPLTTVGDLLGYNGTSSTRVPVGTDAFALFADHTQSFGWAWKSCPLCQQTDPLGPTHGGTGLASFTSGGIIYASSGVLLASSSALGLNLPVFGGGAGGAPFTGTVQGNTIKVVTYAGSAPTTGDCASFDSNGNAVDSGFKCSGTLFSQTATVTIANTGVETALIGSGVGSLTLPGKLLRCRQIRSTPHSGLFSTTATPTLQVKFKIAGTTILNSTAVAS